MSQKQIFLGILPYIKIYFTVFEQYQKARLHFIQSISDLANRPQSINHLLKYDVISKLCPLLEDSVPTIQQITAIVVGKIASFSQETAEMIVKANLIPIMIRSSGMETVCILFIFYFLEVL